MSVTKTVDGWHNFTESGTFGDGSGFNTTGATRRIFVAASGSDSNSGTAASPMLTIAHALTFIRPGQPDWLLLNQGDTWTTDQTVGVQFPSGVGKSADEPFVLTAYNSGTPYWRLSNPAALARPILKGGTNCRGISPQGFGTSPMNFYAIVGIEIAASIRDPNSADFDPLNARLQKGNNGAGMGAQVGPRVDFQLYEDCWAHHFPTNITNANENFYSGDTVINTNTVSNIQVNGGGAPTTAGIFVGQVLGSPGWQTNNPTGGNCFPAGTTVSTISSTSITVSNNATATATANVFLPYTSTGIYQTIVNRCIITDSWSSGTSQGLYYFDGGTQSSPLNVNECVFDHNGWNEVLSVPHALNVNIGTSTFTWIDNNWYLGFLEGDTFKITGATTLPTGVSLNTTYYLRNLSGSSFQLTNIGGINVFGDLTSGSSTISNVSAGDISQLVVGYELTNVAGVFPAGTTVSTIGTTSYTVSNTSAITRPATAVTLIGNPLTLSGSASGVVGPWLLAQASGLSHNNYLDNVTYFTNNISARASTQACQIRAGGLSFNNWYGGNSGSGFIGGNGTIAYCVATEHKANNGACFGPELATGNGSSIINSISANSTSAANNGMQIDNPTLNGLVSGNIIYNTGNTNIANYNVAGPQLITHATSQPFTDPKGTTFSNNQIGNSAGTYTDPTRTSATYVTSLGGGSTIVDFLTNARANRRGAWDCRYTANGVNDYIRAGFNVPMTKGVLGFHA